MKPVIYLDMDGVCTDFASAGIIANQRDPEKVFSDWEMKYKEEFLPYIVMDMDKDEYWQAVHNLGENYWIDLKEYEWFNELYTKLNEITEVIFLSAPTRHATSLSGKLKWLQKRFGWEFQDYIITSHKYRLANKYSILIDDYEKNTEEFIQYGGNAVLFPQIWNSNFHIKDKVLYTLNQVDLWYKNL